jgi:hypothetical protein
MIHIYTMSETANIQHLTFLIFLICKIQHVKYLIKMKSTTYNIYFDTTLNHHLSLKFRQ